MTKIIAVTACPSGVAHTYMAAEALESAAKAKGWEVKVETQGSIGLENELTAEDVASADMVILTKDIGIKFVSLASKLHCLPIPVKSRWSGRCFIPPAIGKPKANR